MHSYKNTYEQTTFCVLQAINISGLMYNKIRRIKFIMVMLKFYCLLLMKLAILRWFQNTTTTLHSTSWTYPATKCDKTGLHHREEDGSKPTAHRWGIAYRIRQETLPAGVKFNLQWDLVREERHFECRSKSTVIVPQLPCRSCWWSWLQYKWTHKNCVALCVSATVGMRHVEMCLVT